MQRLNRSTHAPVGAAFFLFLGLAILPVSLRVAGVQVSFSPRLSAAMDAWQQIAEVFGASYQPGTGADLAAVKDSDFNPAGPSDNCVASQKSACSREFENRNEIVNEISETPTPMAAPARRACPKGSSPVAHPANQVASIVFSTSEIKSRAVVALNALKPETETRGELFRGLEKLKFVQGFAPVVEIRNLPDPRSMRVLVRMKRAATASSEKTAECKVFSALASERRREYERAVLTGVSSTNPDNSEF